MRKNLLFLFSLAVPALVQAQTRTSVANGNATNPFTWDCTCIPLPGNDIVINHDVTLDADFAFVGGSVTINATGALMGGTPDRFLGVGGGSFTNHGILVIYNLLHSGGTFTNNGVITVTNGFAIGGTAHTVNNAELNVNDSLLIDMNAKLTTSNMTNAKYTASSGTLINTGHFMGTDVWNSGTIDSHTGAGIELMNNLYTSGTIHNGSLLHINNDFFNSENVTNNSQIIVEHDLYNGDSIGGTAIFTNNSAVSVMHDLLNSETLNGIGTWCVANNTSNSGDVGGTLSFCDQTGDDFDFNIGTIAGTVTFCTGGACTIGVKENETTDASVYPNPTSALVNIEMNTAGTYQVVLINTLGETVQTQNFSGTRTQISTETFSPGVYHYRITGNGANVSGTLIKE